MVQIINESVMESMLSKLKENVKYTSDSLANQILDSTRIDPLLKNLREVMEKSMDQSTKASLSMIMLELQHLGDQCVYCADNVTRATEDFTACMYALETLYEQYKNMREAMTIGKILAAGVNGDNMHVMQGDVENMERAYSTGRSASEPCDADQQWDRYREWKARRLWLKLP
jgi:hypothetical protein